MQELESRVRAALDQYEMIQEGDRVAVGVSGGKDSLVLLCALANLRRYHTHAFQVTALSIDPCFGGISMDYTGMEALCRDLQVELVIRRTRLGQVIFEERKEKNPCSLCARMRRGILHNMAKEQNCTKLALGHHMDDAVNTFFMNLLYGGSISCFAPKTYLSRKDITVIRPMIFCREREVEKAARRLRLPVMKSTCPANGATARAETDTMVKFLEKRCPDLESKVIGALQRGDIDRWGK